MPVISPVKANHLFWLARYATRLHAQLHFLRVYYDRCLDEGQEDAIQEYCRRLSLPTCTEDRDDFLYHHLFSNETGSLRYCLNCLNDNSIVLREELTTNAISYINLCVATLDHCQNSKNVNIIGIQPITDYILAFWGCVFQHVTSIPTLQMLSIGKHVEFIDIHTRFSLPYARIAAEWDNLDECLSLMDIVVEENNRKALAEIFSNEHNYKNGLPGMFGLLNSLILV